MEITIKKLSAELADDFFGFFDNDAFSDHDEWKWCYCLESHLSAQENDKLWGQKKKRRKKAEELIQSGTMTGYLIYDASRVIGWCNVGDKSDYRSICENKKYRTDILDKGKIKIIYCMDIAPNYRGRGIANLVVEKAVADAKAEGFSYIEAYPFTDKEFIYQYRGPRRLYEKHGFVLYRELTDFYIMRRAL